MPIRKPGKVTKTVARLMRHASETTTGHIARAIGVDRSAISHRLSGRHALQADHLEVYCDYLDSIEPVEGILDALGYRAVPKDRNAAVGTVQRESWHLMEAIGRFGSELCTSLEDGKLSNEERAQLRRLLVEVRVTADGLIAKMPEGE